MSKFDILKEKQTNGYNYDIGPDDIIKKFEEWDKQHGIETSGVDFNAVVAKFNSLPENIEGLAQEVYDLCPDIIDQGFGEMDGMIEFKEEIGEELSPEIQKLIEGVDFQDENFSMVLLQRSLKYSSQVSLWWD